MNIYGVFFFLAGMFTISGAFFDWDWFMNNRRAKIFVKLLGRNGARVFYGILGIGFMLFGIAALLGNVNLQN